MLIVSIKNSFIRYELRVKFEWFTYGDFATINKYKRYVEACFDDL